MAGAARCLGSVGALRMAIDRDAVRAWVELSCVAQGVPVVVSDAGVVAQVGGLVRLGSPRGGPRQGSARGGQGSQSPAGDDAVRVDGVTWRARKDGGVVEDGGNDRRLAS